MSLSELQRLAVEVAEAGARVHYAADPESLSVQQKSAVTDLVTVVDGQAEAAMVGLIRKHRPDDRIIGEEGAEHGSSDTICWHLDPLDGTVNFIAGYPAHAVSVGIVVDADFAVGVVTETSSRMSYVGRKNFGAFCDGQPLKLSQKTDLQAAVIGTGFLANVAVRRRQGELLSRLLPQLGDIRRTGCPALDLCHVASGKIDGFFEFGLGSWDYAAGAAIVEAAGGRVECLQPRSLPAPLIIAGNNEIVDGLARLLTKTGAI